MEEEKTLSDQESLGGGFQVEITPERERKE